MHVFNWSLDDKGEVLGAFSISIEREKDMLKRVASVRMLHQPFDNNNTVSYPLQRRVHSLISPSLLFLFSNAIPVIIPVFKLHIF